MVLIYYISLITHFYMLHVIVVAVVVAVVVVINRLHVIFSLHLSFVSGVNHLIEFLTRTESFFIVEIHFLRVLTYTRAPEGPYLDIHATPRSPAGSFLLRRRSCVYVS